MVTSTHDDGALSRFEEVVVPHLSSAWNFARWLTRVDADAEDVVQEASLRAYRAIASFRGGDPRAWLLAIVRNTWATWARRRPHDEPLPDDGALDGLEDLAGTPEELALRTADRERVRAAVASLPSEFREVIVLRELEELSYKEIADVTGAPIGTVMSRLSRARTRLERLLLARPVEEART